MTGVSDLSTPITKSMAWAMFSALATIAIVCVLGIWLGAHYHTDTDGTMDAVGGAALFLATVTRAQWFWNHPKVLFVRGIIGDRGASGLYVAIALGLGLFAVNRIQYWHDAATTCHREYVASLDSHQRMRILASQPVVHVGGPTGMLGAPTILTCSGYREHGAF